jgi:5-methylcytosine-specific restriction endonuclease McrA
VVVLPEEPTPAVQTGHLAAVAAVPPPVRQPAQVDPLTAERSRLHVPVSRRLLEKLAAARDALSHSHPSASEEVILEVGLDLILQRFAKRRGIGAKPRAASSKKTTEQVPPPSTPRSRHAPAHVWRAVWERDRGCCAWPLAHGGVCGATDRLELDHVKGFALGARTTIEECRILCRFHQDVSARRLYGDGLMNNYTKPKGPACSEPVGEYLGSPRSPALRPPPHVRVSRATRSQFPRAAPPRPEASSRCPAPATVSVTSHRRSGASARGAWASPRRARRHSKSDSPRCDQS